ncbi:MAG: hypothetical protein ACYS0K_23010 [Planctomycetota bacterium]|jgi:hypothetical protein
MSASDKTIEVAAYVLKHLGSQLYLRHAEAKGRAIVRAEQAIPTDAEPEVVEALRAVGSQWLRNFMGTFGFRVVQGEYGKEWESEFDESAGRNSFATDTALPSKWGYVVTVEERPGGLVAKAVGFPDPEERRE